MFRIKNTFACLLTVLFLTSCSKEKNKDANLIFTGNIKGLKTGTLYIEKLADSTLVVLDSITFNGKSDFESHLTIDSPQMLYLFLDKGQTNSIDNSLFIFAEPGKMTLETTLESFYSNAKITGSKNHELFLQYKKLSEPFVNKKVELFGEEIKARKLEKPQTVIDSIFAEQEMLIRRQYLRAVNFALNNKEYEIAPYIAVFEINDINRKYLDTLQSSITPKVSESKYGKMLKQLIEERKKTEE